MRKIKLLIFGLLIIMSCKDKENNEIVSKSRTQLEPVVQVEPLTTNFKKWWVYHYNEISLSADFNPLDEHSEPISKERFLKQLVRGNYIPIEMKTNDSLKTYQLFPLPEGSNKDIVSTMRYDAMKTYSFFKWEGKEFPEFGLQTLDGEHYNNDSLNGKTTLVKTWFIACKPCIQEMPLLNDYVERYADDDSVQFLSLALDSGPQLTNFLTKVDFDYAVAADQKDLIEGQLGLSGYPTHLVIGESGKIEKVFSKATEMIRYIETGNSSKKEETKTKKLPTPPPPPPTASAS